MVLLVVPKYVDVILEHTLFNVGNEKAFRESSIQPMFGNYAG